MSTHINDHAASFRDHARQPDGRFGQQESSRASSVDLGEGPTERRGPSARTGYSAAAAQHLDALQVMRSASSRLNDAALHRLGVEAQSLEPGAAYLSVEFEHDVEFSSPTPIFRLHRDDGTEFDTWNADGLFNAMDDLTSGTDHAALFDRDDTQPSLDRDEQEKLGLTETEFDAVWPVSSLVDRPPDVGTPAETKQAARASRRVYETAQSEANTMALREIAENAHARFPEATHLALVYDSDDLTNYYVTATDEDGTDLYHRHPGGERDDMAGPWRDYDVDIRLLEAQTELDVDELYGELVGEDVLGYWRISPLTEP